MLAAEASQAAGPSAPTVRGAVFTAPAARQPMSPAAGPFEPADLSASYSGASSHRNQRQGLRKLLWSAGTCAVLLLWLIFGYFPNTPSYAIWTFYRSVENRDAEAAADFVDFDQIVQNLIDTKTAETTGTEHSEDESAANAFGAGLARMMSGTIAALVRAKFKQAIEQGQAVRKGALFQALSNLHRRGRNAAETKLEDNEGKVVLAVTLRRGQTGDWRVTSLSGSLIDEAMSHAAKEASSGTRIEPRSEPSAPLPASPDAFASPSAVVPTLNPSKIHPPSNVDMARAHWCGIPPQGEDAEAGITDLLAKINANACAEMQANGVDITKGCAWGVSREHVAELLRQAAQDWEDGVFHCKDHKVE